MTQGGVVEFVFVREERSFVIKNKRLPGSLNVFFLFYIYQDGLKNYRLVSIYCLYLINYFELSNIGVIARGLNLHIVNRFTLDFVPHLP